MQRIFTGESNIVLIFKMLLVPAKGKIDMGPFSMHKGDQI